jgi:hypothetical protein
MHAEPRGPVHCPAIGRRVEAIELGLASTQASFAGRTAVRRLYLDRQAPQTKLHIVPSRVAL